MEKTPLISIVTITYNAEGVLAPTMRSIAEQTFRDFEHIVVDGASTDGTLQIARRNPGTRILSERDGGLYDAMNKGLRLARGRYVVFMNAGDAFHSPTVLEEYAKWGAKGYDIIYADTQIVDSQRHRIGDRHYSAPEILTFESFSKGMLVCHQAFMVRRSIAPEYDLQYRFSADYDWCIRCIRATTPSRCKNLNMVAVDYLSDGLTDKNKMKSLRERFRVMQSHYGLGRTLGRHAELVVGAIFK